MTLPAPNADCLHGTVDGLNALIWRRHEDKEMLWCWLSEGTELLRTIDGRYVGIYSHKHHMVGPIAWRRLDFTRKIVLVNDRQYPWVNDNEELDTEDYLNATRGMNDNLPQ